MFLILAFLLWAVVWGFFHANPKGVPAAALLACNVAVMAGGTAFMIVLAVGGLARNLFLFPLSRRKLA